jgi:hypothetical protein
MPRRIIDFATILNALISLAFGAKTLLFRNAIRAVAFLVVNVYLSSIEY